MNKFLMLLLVLTATQADAEEHSIASLTVADCQNMYESESDDHNREFQQATQAFFNGYVIGFVDGMVAALAVAGVISESEASEINFVDCMPDTGKLFYEMLSVTDERADMIVPTFVLQAVIGRCGSVLWELVPPPSSR